MVTKHNYDFIKPRVEIGDKSFIDARKYFYECKNQNSLFYNSWFILFFNKYVVKIFLINLWWIALISRPLGT